MPPRYRSGEFARRTGVSVRTLRHYDRLGLLVPAERSESGYRMYGAAELLRLPQIVALKRFGFSLDDVCVILDRSPSDLSTLLEQQRILLLARREEVDQALQVLDSARQRIAAGEPQWKVLEEVIRAQCMDTRKEWVRQHLTPEQLARMKQLTEQSYSDAARANLAARPVWTEEDQQRVTARYEALWEGVRRAVAAGAAPGGPDGQALAAEARDLMEAFTRRDPEVET
ncbi:MAG: MerR family transcriptional regulator, partial [Armatimonadetes bacterium]|nr:MerR family transcriptional regulator [Armatimonadota bacterium]